MSQQKLRYQYQPETFIIKLNLLLAVGVSAFNGIAYLNLSSL